MRTLIGLLRCQLLLHLFPVCNGSMQKLVANTGESVTLPCRYDVGVNGLTTMCWGRAKVPTSQCRATIVTTDGENVTLRESSRYQLRSGVEKGDVSLTIVNLTENDSGIYGCRVEIPGWLNDQKVNFYLTVIKVSASAPMTTQPPTTEKATDKSTAATRSTPSASTMEFVPKLQSTAQSNQTTSQSLEEDHRFRLHAALFPLLLLVIPLAAMLIFILRIKKKEKKGKKKSLVIEKAKKSRSTSVFYVSAASALQSHGTDTAVDNIYQCEAEGAS